MTIDVIPQSQRVLAHQAAREVVAAQAAGAAARELLGEGGRKAVRRRHAGWPAVRRASMLGVLCVKVCERLQSRQKNLLEEGFFGQGMTPWRHNPPIITSE